MDPNNPSYHEIKAGEVPETKHMQHLKTLCQGLAARANAATAAASQRYFPVKINALGISNGDVMAFADLYTRQHRDLTSAEFLQLCETLVTNGAWHEEVLLGFALIRKLVQRNFDDHLLERFRYWLEHHLSNWAQCDDLCLKVIFPFFQARPHLINSIGSWTESASPWCRRAANVALVKFIHRKLGSRIYRLPLERVFHNSLTLMADEDPYVQKSVGWLLKVAAAHHTDEVVAFIEANISRMERGTLRYAIEKLEPARRQALMALGM